MCKPQEYGPVFTQNVTINNHFGFFLVNTPEAVNTILRYLTCTPRVIAVKNTVCQGPVKLWFWSKSRLGSVTVILWLTEKVVRTFNPGVAFTFVVILL